MGQGSFDKERSPKAGRIFEGTRSPRRNGKLAVGNASRNSHQREIHKGNKDRLSTRGLFDEE